ncbi:hypothetical protein E2C01_070346 [Portunus trituberculatus]|uniref:Uncharacterized protein n=1 Tax=Portunus trituberculatus TaxID=210409 RepID=A0A5B7I1B9_PORTR|nr:hypothetical protein [Portunus trituberculatus]
MQERREPELNRGNQFDSHNVAPSRPRFVSPHARHLSARTNLHGGILMLMVKAPVTYCTYFHCVWQFLLSPNSSDLLSVYIVRVRKVIKETVSLPED